MVAKEGHTYLRTHMLSGRLLQFQLLDELPELLDRARESKVGRTAKTLLKQGPFRITLVAMRKGADMNRHHVDGPVSIQVLRGRIRLEVKDCVTELGAGGLTTLEARIEHDVSAITDTAFLITMSWQGE
jgi:quercetin dioxygenase-like cupin family protein